MLTRHTFQHRIRRSGRTLILSLLALPIFAGGIAPATAMAATHGTRQEYFKQAAHEFGVPENILLALSYNESRWSAPAGQMSMDGGYGNMNLRTQTNVSLDGRGSGKPTPKSSKPADYYTLNVAASLLHTSTDNLKRSDKDNIRGGAAVLAHYAKQLHGNRLPSTASDWYDAVAKYSGSDDGQTAQQFADDVFSTTQNGSKTTTTDHQTMWLQSDHNVRPQHDRLKWVGFKYWPKKNVSNSDQAECPSSLNCTFVPAAYQQNSSDPADYGSFDYAHRPKDMDIKYIVIHDTEGSYDSAIAHFQDPTAYVSGNYIIRSSDGAVTQMVHNKDVSWGAGDWYVNMHAINIEHEGFAAQGATWYSEAMYQSSSKLVKYLAAKYHIPLDRQHIIGHDNVPTTSPAGLPGQHNDPGPYWDWSHYMDLLRNGKQYGQQNSNIQPGQTITISPNFAQNQPPVQDCSTGACTDLPAQGSNFVYLRTQPNASAPLLSDPYLHPDNSAGTTSIADWSARAISGEKFVVADVQGNWTAVYYGGKVGWFYNPSSTPTARRSWSLTLKARAGLSSLPIYGVAYPEASAYPSDVPVQNITQLYSAPSGQRYTTSGLVPTDYFYDATIDYSKPHDHLVVRGHDKYYQIWFNQRIAYVKANDVDVNYR